MAIKSCDQLLLHFIRCPFHAFDIGKHNLNNGFKTSLSGAFNLPDR